MRVRTPAILLLPVWPLPRSLATTDGISVDVFSSPYLDVSVQAVPHAHLCIQCTLTILQIAGFPHSEIHGSLAACASPWHIAGCRVLHRLLMPRHSPCALISLTISGSQNYAGSQKNSCFHCSCYPKISTLELLLTMPSPDTVPSVALLLPLFSFQGASPVKDRNKILKSL